MLSSMVHNKVTRRQLYSIQSHREVWSPMGIMVKEEKDRWLIRSYKAQNFIDDLDQKYNLLNISFLDDFNWYSITIGFIEEALSKGELRMTCRRPDTTRKLNIVAGGVHQSLPLLSKGEREQKRKAVKFPSMKKGEIIE